MRGAPGRGMALGSTVAANRFLFGLLAGLALRRSAAAALSASSSTTCSMSSWLADSAAIADVVMAALLSCEECCEGADAGARAAEVSCEAMPRQMRCKSCDSFSVAALVATLASDSSAVSRPRRTASACCGDGGTSAAGGGRADSAEEALSSGRSLVATRPFSSPSERFGLLANVDCCTAALPSPDASSGRGVSVSAGEAAEWTDRAAVGEESSRSAALTPTLHLSSAGLAGCKPGGETSGVVAEVAAGS